MVVTTVSVAPQRALTGTAQIFSVRGGLALRADDLARAGLEHNVDLVSGRAISVVILRR
jgi:hypothetical protein